MTQTSQIGRSGSGAAHRRRPRVVVPDAVHAFQRGGPRRGSAAPLITPTLRSRGQRVIGSVLMVVTIVIRVEVIGRWVVLRRGRGPIVGGGSGRLMGVPFWDEGGTNLLLPRLVVVVGVRRIRVASFARDCIGGAHDCSNFVLPNVGRQDVVEGICLL